MTDVSGPGTGLEAPSSAAHLTVALTRLGQVSAGLAVTNKYTRHMLHSLVCVASGAMLVVGLPLTAMYMAKVGLSWGAILAALALETGGMISITSFARVRADRK